MKGEEWRRVERENIKITQVLYPGDFLQKWM